MKNLYTLGGIAIVAIILIVLGTMYVNKGATSMTATSTDATTTATTAAAGTAPAKTSSGTTKVTTTTTVTTTPPAGTVTGAAPQISSVTPTAASVGSTVVIKGVGFSQGTNYILFGTSKDLSKPDGSPDNAIVTAGSPDGMTLSFTVPATGPSGLLCDSNNNCNGVSGAKVVAGQYPVAVRNQFGTSQVVVFTVSGS